MKIAILGATSQIAKDLIVAFSIEQDKHLHLFARRPDDVIKWLVGVGLSERYLVDDYSAFSTQEFDAIINFVGVGNPAQADAMGASIFDVTLQYDDLALNYVRQNPRCRYIFLSSGAAYGLSFNSPVDAETKATIAINNLQSQDWYGVAKLHAECRHRSLVNLPIIDIRVFNYFSHTQDMNARFLTTDIVRAIRNRTILITSEENVVRDYIGAVDFYNMVNAVLSASPTNKALDCFSKAPADKLSILALMRDYFDLKFVMVKTDAGVNGTGNKAHYYSLNHHASDLGYVPVLNSLECIHKEMQIIFHS